MIRILFVSHYLSRNGTEAFMMSVFRNINNAKFHIDFLCFSRKDVAYEDEIVRGGSSLFFLPERKKGLSYYQSLDAFFKKHQYDVIHWCAGSCTSIAPLYYAWKYQIPIRIAHSHSSSCVGKHNLLLHYLLRPVMNRLATERLSCSDKAGKWLFKSVPYKVVKNGVDTKKYSFDVMERAKKRAELGISPYAKVIGHIGRFDSNKNHSFILDVFRRYINLHSDAVLMLIGVGATKTIIEEKVKSLHLEDRVLFLGERTDVPSLLQAMDLFIMPSLFEGLPFVLVEAQAAGLPCLVSDTVDAGARITPHLDFMSLKQSAEEWAKAIGDCFAKHQRGNSDQYIIDTGYSIEDTINMLEEVYSSYIDRR